MTHGLAPYARERSAHMAMLYRDWSAYFLGRAPRSFFAAWAHVSDESGRVVVGELCERNGVDQMKASISKTFTVGAGDDASSLRFEVAADDDRCEILVVLGRSEDDGGQLVESVSFDDAAQLDFIIEALCRLRAWQDRPKQEMVIGASRRGLSDES